MARMKESIFSKDPEPPVEKFTGSETLCRGILKCDSIIFFPWHCMPEKRDNEQYSMHGMQQVVPCRMHRLDETGPGLLRGTARHGGQPHVVVRPLQRGLRQKSTGGWGWSRPGRRTWTRLHPHFKFYNYEYKLHPHFKFYNYKYKLHPHFKFYNYKLFHPDEVM